MTKAVKVKHQSSVTSGNIPTFGNVAVSTNLGIGEIAVNNEDGKVFIVKTTSGTPTSVMEVGQLAGFKNYLINGGCQISQRGNVAASASGTWGYGGADRIATLIQGTTATGTLNIYTGNGYSTSGYAHGVQATTTGAGAIYFQQRIEAINTVGLNGRTITVSCYLYQNTGSTQTAYITIGKPTTTADVFSAQTALSSSGNFSIPSTTLTKISWTYTLGATEASLGLYAQVGYSSVGAVTAKDFLIGDFQMEKGSIATPFEIRPAGLELVLCQRYFQSLASSTYSYAVGAASLYTGISFQQMRVSPTAIVTAQNLFANTSSITISVQTSRSLRMSTQSSAAGYAGGEPTFTLSAEL